MTGWLATGMSCLADVCVSGRSRVPCPPAMTSPRTTLRRRWAAGSRLSVEPRRMSGRRRRGLRRRDDLGRVGPGAEGREQDLGLRLLQEDDRLAADAPRVPRHAVGQQLVRPNATDAQREPDKVVELERLIDGDVLRECTR